MIPFRGGDACVVGIHFGPLSFGDEINVGSERIGKTVGLEGIWKTVDLKSIGKTEPVAKDVDVELPLCPPSE